MSQDPYRTIFESAPDGIFLVDMGGTIREANAEAYRLFGYPSGGLEGIEVERLVPAAVRSRHREHRERYRADPTARPMGMGMELEAQREDGTTFPVEISLSPIEVAGEAQVIVTLRDVSKRKRLRDFGAGAMRASEDVRTVIARELHDSTAQELATHLIRLRLLERAESEEKRHALVLELREGLQRTSDGVRRIARGLRPPELEDAGLLVALQAHARSVEATRASRVRLTPFTGVDEALTEDGRLAVYRIVQEALTNAASHGRAEMIEVEVVREGARISIRVEDDGVGFDLARVETGGEGLGIVGMRERATMLGGSLSITSAPGEGTRVDVELPVEIQRETEHV